MNTHLPFETPRLVTYRDDPLNSIGKLLLDSLVQCYIEVFNESWGDSWTYDSALKEIQASLKKTQYRSPILSLLLCDKDNVVGFAWGICTTVEHIALSDMPFYYEPEEQIRLLGLTKDYIGLKPVLVYRECGAKHKYRKDLFTLMTLELCLYGKACGIEKLIFWTSRDSSVRKYFMGLKVDVISESADKKISIYIGSIQYFLNVLGNIRNSGFSASSYKKLIVNARHHMKKYNL